MVMPAYSILHVPFMIGLNRMLRLRHNNVLFFSCNAQHGQLIYSIGTPNCYICIAIYSANLFACHLRVTGGQARSSEKNLLIAPHRIRARCSCRIFCHTYKGLLFFFDHMCTDLARKPVEMLWLSPIRMVSQPECQNTYCMPSLLHRPKHFVARAAGCVQYCRGLLV